MQWRDATVGGRDTTGLSLDLPCAEDPELFFAESPQGVEQAKAMCRGCRARLACLAGALERAEPWGVWGGELLLRGVIVPRKRPRGRPRRDVVAIGRLPPLPGWSSPATRLVMTLSNGPSRCDSQTKVMRILGAGLDGDGAVDARRRARARRHPVVGAVTGAVIGAAFSGGFLACQNRRYEAITGNSTPAASAGPGEKGQI